jgi:nitrate/nitrite transporter NarK
VGTFLYCHLPAYWPIPTIFLGSVAAASATGFINMMGNLGGFFGPFLVGNSAREHETFGPALFLLAPLPLIAAGIILMVGLLRRPQPVPPPETVPAEQGIMAGPPAPQDAKTG